MKRLGRQRHDGAFPDAVQRTAPDGRPVAAAALSSTALVDIVSPIMRDASVGGEHCHPHVLRHTFATLYLRRRAHDPGALTKLQELLGHASLETTRGYLHHTRDELERSMRVPDPERARCGRCGACQTQRPARGLSIERQKKGPAGAGPLDKPPGK